MNGGDGTLYMDGSLITALLYYKLLSTMASRTNILSHGPLCLLLPLPSLTLPQPSLMQAPQTAKCAMKTESNIMLGFLGRRVLWPLGILIFISALFTLQRRHFTDGPSIAHSRSSDKSDSLKHVFNSTLGVSGDSALFCFFCFRATSSGRLVSAVRSWLTGSLIMASS